MKTGVIIYIVGNVPDDWDEDINKMNNHSAIQADTIEVVVSNFGSYDVHYAWWKLVTKGMQIINCRLALFDRAKKLTLTGKDLRLCG
jgi:hypothetical protein